MDVLNQRTILFDKDARTAIMGGVNSLADAVAKTLGPKGRNVAIDRHYAYPGITKDGVTVARNIGFTDRGKNIGANMLKQAALKTGTRAGDGTTTSIVLAREIANRALEHVDSGKNAYEIIRGIEAAAKGASNAILDIAEDIGAELSEEQLIQIATISSNNDKKLGKLVGEAAYKVGKDGMLALKKSQKNDTWIEPMNGFVFDRGYTSDAFITDHENNRCVMDNPFIVIARQEVFTVEEMANMIKILMEEDKDRPVLFILRNCVGEALASLIHNKENGNWNTCVVSTPFVEDVCDDIAAVTNAQVLGEHIGVKLNKADVTAIGVASRVEVNKGATSIFFSKEEAEARIKSAEEKLEELGDTPKGRPDERKIHQRKIDLLEREIDRQEPVAKGDKLAGRVQELAKREEEEELEGEKTILKRRIANLQSRVMVIHVGASSETELGERFDRIEDAVMACRSAHEKGIVPGGGTAYLHAKKTLQSFDLKKGHDGPVSDEFMLGWNLFADSLDMPFNQIFLNSGIPEESKKSDEVSIKSLKQYVSEHTGRYFGIDANSLEDVEMIESGIIDPAMVNMEAITNAASAANMIIVTDCVLELDEYAVNQMDEKLPKEAFL